VDDAPYLQERSDVCSSFRNFCHTLDHAGLWLSEVDAAAAWQNGFVFLTTYQQLAYSAWNDNVFLYKLRPKWHYFAHLVDRIYETRENPAKLDVFAAESFMGKVKQVARLCDERLIGTRVTQCLLMYICIRWSARRRVHST
jgi:hypothetical protein